MAEADGGVLWRASPGRGVVGPSLDHLEGIFGHLGDLAWVVFEGIWGIWDASESHSGLAWGRIREPTGVCGCLGPFWGAYWVVLG